MRVITTDPTIEDRDHLLLSIEELRGECSPPHLLLALGHTLLKERGLDQPTSTDETIRLILFPPSAQLMQPPMTGSLATSVYYTPPWVALRNI